MILIADSGASKSDWILIDGKSEFISFHLVGLNPFYLSSKQIEDIVSKELTPFIEAKKIEALYFYGSGCSSVYKCMLMEDVFRSMFQNADIHIESDLLGAARALFGKREGIANILGTGSNACYFDGEKIVENIISLGYFFGDEGSGAHMGKTFIKDLLLNKLPGDLNKRFKSEYNYTRDNILDAVYNLPFPNRFLASFCEFYANNLADKYVYNLISDSFREFFINHVEKFKQFKKVPLSFVGSVAYFLSRY
ncbi:MAG: ATPase [Bacteroidales bacterium]